MKKIRRKLLMKYFRNDSTEKNIFFKLLTVKKKESLLLILVF